MSPLGIHKNPSAAQLRQFAGLCLPAFGFVAGYLVYAKAQQPQAAFCIWAIAGALAVLGLFVPRWIKPLYLGLVYGTFPIGWLVSHALLCVIFFLVLTPIGMLLRLLGHDPLSRRFDRNAKSYWMPRAPTDNPRSYFKQF